MEYLNKDSGEARNEKWQISPQKRPINELTLLNDYISIYRTYSSYKKVMSIVNLAYIGLPTLKGFVTKSISEEVLQYLEAWMREYQMERLTLRFDSTHPNDNRVLMTSNPTLKELYNMRYLLREGIIAIIMEENDRFQQGYSFLTAFYEDYLICEVLGPGFDPGDLTRGQMVPHERFLFKRKEKYDENYKDLSIIDIIQHSISTRESYRECVNYRYHKIYNILQRGLGYSVQIGSQALSVQQRKEVEIFLEQRNSTLLKYKDEYAPISYEKIHNVYGFISELDMFYSNEVRMKVVVASFLKKQNLVFWDIFGSDKYIRRSY